MLENSALKAFIAVARIKSFSGAAESLFITQPAVSKRIASLEATLECALFERHGKQVELTNEGERLMPLAIDILRKVDQLELAAKESVIAGRLVIAVSHYMALHQLPSLLPKFLNQYPNVKVEIELMTSESAIGRVNKGFADIAFATSSAHFLQAYSSMERLLIEQETMTLFCTAEFKSRQQWHSSVPTPEQLSTAAAVLPPSSSQPYIELASTFQTEFNLPLPKNQHIVSSFAEIDAMIRSGLGWGMLPSRYSEGLIEINPFRNNITRDLSIIARNDKSRRPTTNAFLDIIRTLP